MSDNTSNQMRPYGREPYLDVVCFNCGGRRGLHNHMNQRCPKDINASEDHTEYRETVFKYPPADLELAQQEITNKTIAELKADNLRLSNEVADLKKVLKEMYEGKSYPDNWEEFCKENNLLL